MRSIVRRVVVAGVVALAVGALAGPAAAAAGATAGAAPVTHAATQPGAFLTGAQITFHTNGDDKDGDTDVFVFVIRGDGSGAAASAHNPFGHFDDNTFNGPFPLFSGTGTIASQLSTFDVNIIIVPFGHDTWKFDYALTLTFSDGTSFIARQQNITLDQDNNVLFTPFNLVTQVAVPDVGGQRQAAAEADIRAAGLTVGSVSHHVDPTCTFIGTVSDQNPGAGTQVDPGTPVNITIGDKPKTPCE